MDRVSKRGVAICSYAISTSVFRCLSSIGVRFNRRRRRPRTTTIKGTDLHRLGAAPLIITHEEETLS